MKPERIALRAIAPQRWKNGAGVTRELAFGGANRERFDWRISIAEVDRDAPFSVFSGIDRCIVLLGGAGLHLRADDGSIDHALTEPLQPFSFSGDVALEASVVDGSTHDFNVMTRRGVWRADVRCLRATATLPAADVTVQWCAGGDWSISAAGIDSELEPEHALLWRAPAGSITVRARGATSGALLHVALCHDRRR